MKRTYRWIGPLSEWKPIPWWHKLWIVGLVIWGLVLVVWFGMLVEWWATGDPGW